MIRIRLRSVETLKDFISGMKPGDEMSITIEGYLNTEDLSLYVFDAAPTVPGYDVKIFYLSSEASTSITAKFEKIDFKSLFIHAIEKTSLIFQELTSRNELTPHDYIGEITVKRKNFWKIFPLSDKLIAMSGAYPEFDYENNKWDKPLNLYVNKKGFEASFDLLQPIADYLKSFDVNCSVVKV